jgi:hypothetical protein
MKEHFNSVNTNSVNRNVTFENAREMGVIDTNTRPPKPGTAETVETLQPLLDEEQWSNPTIRPMDFYDTGDVAGMDFDMAMENLRFVTAKAENADGRHTMSQAHLPVNPQKVVQLFGLS